MHMRGKISITETGLMALTTTFELEMQLASSRVRKRPRAMLIGYRSNCLYFLGSLSARMDFPNPGPSSSLNIRSGYTGHLIVIIKYKKVERRPGALSVFAELEAKRKSGMNRCLSAAADGNEQKDVYCGTTSSSVLSSGRLKRGMSSSFTSL